MSKGMIKKNGFIVIVKSPRKMVFQKDFNDSSVQLRCISECLLNAEKGSLMSF